MMWIYDHFKHVNDKARCIAIEWKPAKYRRVVVMITVDESSLGDTLCYEDDIYDITAGFNW